jgi:uncharacterized membrane protein YoaK (UPF0700 family)
VSRATVQRIHRTARLPRWLACVGGFVDGAGYLVLWEMFTSHMSGNSVKSGVLAGQQQWARALHQAFPIPLFVLGVAVGAALGEVLQRRRVRSTIAVGLGIEAVLLGLFLVAGQPAMFEGKLWPDGSLKFYLLAALPALAMGLQNATLRRFGGVTSNTTFITGNLTSFAEDAVQYLFWLGDHAGRRGTRRLSVLLRLSPRRPVFQRMRLLLAIWVGYVIGAVLGAAAVLRWELLALLAPITCLVLFVIIDTLRPLSLPSEK